MVQVPHHSADVVVVELRALVLAEAEPAHLLEVRLNREVTVPRE